MHRNNVLLVLSSGVALALGTSVPRGVAPEDARLYAPSTENTFTCLTHPSIRIPISQINDDFCDCPDGSDEPGTSACANLPQKNLGIRGFYCRNTHHTPSYLPLSRVNDGICDYDFCCDGSDEYDPARGVVCKNKCKEIGTAARKLSAEKNRMRSGGARKRSEFLKQAARLRKEMEDNIATTKLKIQGQEVKVKQLQDSLEETEKREKSKIVRNPKPGSKISVVASLAKDSVAEYKAALGSLREDMKETQRRLDEAETILKGLKEHYNPNFNDEGVKTAVRGWEEYLAKGNTEKLQGGTKDSDLEELVNGQGVNWDEFLVEGDAVDDIAPLYVFEEYLPEYTRTWIHTKVDSLRQFLVENGILAPKPHSGSLESKAITAARDALSAAEKDLQDSQTTISDLTSDLSKPYGSSDVFRPLKGTCVSREFGEYKYEYCFLTTAHQRSLKDSSSTSLGDFERIDSKDDISGASSDKSVFGGGWEEAHEEPLSGVTMVHGGGQQCWNGPRRSVAVDLYCAEENEIRSVREEEKCVYRFEVGTPAVCGEEEGGRVKDEL